MQISYNGIKALKEHEGFKAEAYRDTGGVWTIGYGTIKVDSRAIEAGQTCTREQAEQWLYKDLTWAQTAVNQLVRVQLQQYQYDSLVDFVYNIGENAFSKSTLLHKLNSSDFIGAAKEFDRWVFDNKRIIPGLVTRRRMEREMFEGPSNHS